jgi:hypothetical protein
VLVIRVVTVSFRDCTGQEDWFSPLARTESLIVEIH